MANWSSNTCRRRWTGSTSTSRRKASRPATGSELRVGQPQIRPSSFPLQSILHGSAAQLAQGVAGNPACRAGAAGADALGRLDCEDVELPVALANLSQRPVDRLAHERPVVVRLALDDG